MVETQIDTIMTLQCLLPKTKQKNRHPSYTTNFKPHF